MTQLQEALKTILGLKILNENHSENYLFQGEFQFIFETGLSLTILKNRKFKAKIDEITTAVYRVSFN